VDRSRIVGLRQRGRRGVAVRTGYPRGRHQDRLTDTTKLVGVVLFFEIMLVVTVLLIAWFALYALYRLVTDES
jgi:hypothetical protein